MTRRSGRGHGTDTGHSDPVPGSPHHYPYHPVPNSPRIDPISPSDPEKKENGPQGPFDRGGLHGVWMVLCRDHDTFGPLSARGTCICDLAAHLPLLPRRPPNPLAVPLPSPQTIPVTGGSEVSIVAPSTPVAKTLESGRGYDGYPLRHTVGHSSP